MTKGGERTLSVKSAVSPARKVAAIAWLLALRTPLVMIAMVLMACCDFGPPGREKTVKAARRNS